MSLPKQPIPYHNLSQAARADFDRLIAHMLGEEAVSGDMNITIAIETRIQAAGAGAVRQWLQPVRDKLFQMGEAEQFIQQNPPKEVAAALDRASKTEKKALEKLQEAQTAYNAIKGELEAQQFRSKQLAKHEAALSTQDEVVKEAWRAFTVMREADAAAEVNLS